MRLQAARHALQARASEIRYDVARQDAGVFKIPLEMRGPQEAASDLEQVTDRLLRAGNPTPTADSQFRWTDSNE